MVSKNDIKKQMLGRHGAFEEEAASRTDGAVVRLLRSLNGASATGNYADRSASAELDFRCARFGCGAAAVASQTIVVCQRFRMAIALPSPSGPGCMRGMLGFVEI